MSSNSSRTLVGWQGVVAEVPADWSLVAVSGDENNGYFRVDSGGTLTLETKWSRAKKNVDLADKLKAYLEDLRRRARKRKVKFEHKIKSKDGGILSFTWRADRKAQGRLWKCEECSRVIIAQVSGGLSDEVSQIASSILPTVVDHSETGWRTWAMYDLVADVPVGYTLEKHKLMSGYIQLVFRKKTNKLIIERWGIANVALKNTSLRQWFEERVARDLAPYLYTIEDIEFEEERGIYLTGRRKGFWEALKSTFEFITLRKPAAFIDGYAWVCEESNRIYSIQSVHTKRENVLDGVLERVVCH
jgi:hypothetical protein